MESAQATLLQMRNDEVKKREDYMSQSGKYLPPFFHDIVPSLRMKPFVTQREKFPNLSDDDVTDIHEEKKVEKEIITSSTPCTTTDLNENLEDLFRNILLERTDDIRKFIEKDPVLRATLHSLLVTDKMEERQESIEQEFSDSHSTEILPNSSSNCNFQEDHLLIHENSSNLMLERPESPDQTEVVGPFSELLLPKVARQVSYLYTLQNVAELWSIFIDHLYTLVQFDLLPVYHNSLTALNTSNTQLTPQPDWVSHESLVCISPL